MQPYQRLTPSHWVVKFPLFFCFWFDVILLAELNFRCCPLLAEVDILEGKCSASLLARPLNERVWLKRMASDRTLKICGDSLSQPTESNSDADHSVDFGQKYPAGVALGAKRFGYDSFTSSAHDSFHDCYFTERTKQHASQSSYGIQVSCSKKSKLEYLEPELMPSSASSNSQELNVNSTQSCAFTEDTKHYTSQSSYRTRTSQKKPTLEFSEPASSCCDFCEEFQVKERPDVRNDKNLLYCGQEIFGTWILQFVRTAFRI